MGLQTAICLRSRSAARGDEVTATGGPSDRRGSQSPAGGAQVLVFDPEERRLAVRQEDHPVPLGRQEAELSEIDLGLHVLAFRILPLRLLRARVRRAGERAVRQRDQRAAARPCRAPCTWPSPSASTPVSSFDLSPFFTSSRTSLNVTGAAAGGGGAGGRRPSATQARQWSPSRRPVAALARCRARRGRRLAGCRRAASRHVRPAWVIRRCPRCRIDRRGRHRRARSRWAAPAGSGPGPPVGLRPTVPDPRAVQAPVQPAWLLPSAPPRSASAAGMPTAASRTIPLPRGQSRSASRSAPCRSGASG